MVAKLIQWCVHNRAMVLLLTVFLIAGGIWAGRHITIDAIPDLSDVQVVIRTEYPGQAPQIVEDQVTYPLTTAMLAVPYAKVVRGYSMFGSSFVYIIFEDGTDLYWARSRVLEQLNTVSSRLPLGISPQLGPDATGVGWIYEYVLTTGKFCPDHPHVIYSDDTQVCPIDGKPLHSPDVDLAKLRSLQDWYLRYELTAVEGVSEVAPVGGFVKQYQVVVDPRKLLAYDMPLSNVKMAIQRSNLDVGGRLIEQSETEYMVRGLGYLGENGNVLGDLQSISLGANSAGSPIYLRDVAEVREGPEIRRGIADWNGEGEVVGGIIVMRFGENARATIERVRARLADLEKGLPPGVAIRVAYDRSDLIERAIHTVKHTLIEEVVVVSLVIVIFLLHIRSALVAAFVLPTGVLATLAIMYILGINANIMSLGGIAISIGVMVDSSIVMVENAHKNLERFKQQHGRQPKAGERISVIGEAAAEVGPTLFFSLLIITVSFLPIFVLGEQSGRLFRPLVYTKTFAMAAAAVLAITIIPVLMVYFIRGRILSERRNPISVLLQKIYQPFFVFVMQYRWLTVLAAIALVAATWIPFRHLGSEFMPPLEEGDLLYMPTTDPGISMTKARELLQQTDKLIKQFPEVETVFGKIGRADTATDPAPLNMIETTIVLKRDKSQWRQVDGRPITTDQLVYGYDLPAPGSGDKPIHVPGLNDALNLPGVTNAWTMPIKTRIDMLSTGIKTPVGIKVMGPDLHTLADLSSRIANVIKTAPATSPYTISAFPEKSVGGNYFDIKINREQIARYGLTVGDVQETIMSALGGMNVTWTVEGLERYPVNLRYPSELRDNIEALRQTLVAAPGSGAQIPLGQLADIQIHKGPPMVKSENARLTSWVFVDIAGLDVGTYVKNAQRAVANQVHLPAGYSIVWSGQYEYMQAARQRLMVVVPMAGVLILLLLYMATRSWLRVGIVLLAVPFSLVGATWLLYLLGYNLSLAVWVGVIALAGLDAETGLVMLLYLDHSYERFKTEGRMNNTTDLWHAIQDGAVQRIRPKTMTVMTTFIGLFPLLWASGAGADTMRRLAAPMIGGLATSFIAELLLYPVLFYIARQATLPHKVELSTPDPA